MHAISFMLKRAHLQTVAYGQQAVKHVPGMTPARFDLMYVLRWVALTEFPPPGPLDSAESQISLRKKLGLHRSTVSKMLKRLEEMGWILRTPDLDDRRTFVISLTEEGLRMIWRCMRRVFRQKTLRKAYELIHRPAPPEEPFDQFFRGTWKGDYQSALAAHLEAAEAAKRRELAKRMPKAERRSERTHRRTPKTTDPPIEASASGVPTRHVVLLLDDTYRTIRRIARHFGDRSDVWFALGCRLPAAC